MLNADQPLDQEASLALLRKYDLSTDDAGYVDERLGTFLWEVLYHHLFGPSTGVEAVTPVSLLLDGQGRLMAIYMGEFRLSQLEADVAAIIAEDPRPVLDRMSNGVRLVHPQRDFEGLADRCEEKGMPELAAYFREVDEEYDAYIYVDGERAAFK